MSAIVPNLQGRSLLRSNAFLPFQFFFFIGWCSFFYVAWKQSGIYDEVFLPPQLHMTVVHHRKCLLLLTPWFSFEKKTLNSLKICGNFFWKWDVTFWKKYFKLFSYLNSDILACYFLLKNSGLVSFCQTKMILWSLKNLVVFIYSFV